MCYKKVNKRRKTEVETMKTEKTSLNKYEFSPLEIVALLNIRGRIKTIQYVEDSIIVVTEEIFKEN